MILLGFSSGLTSWITPVILPRILLLSPPGNVLLNLPGFLLQNSPRDFFTGLLSRIPPRSFRLFSLDFFIGSCIVFSRDSF